MPRLSQESDATQRHNVTRYMFYRGQGHEHLCDTGMPVRNGNPGNDRTTTTKVASLRKQLGTKIATVTRADKRRMVELGAIQVLRNADGGGGGGV